MWNILGDGPLKQPEEPDAEVLSLLFGGGGIQPRPLHELLDRGPVSQPVGSRGDIDDEDDVRRTGL